MEAGGDKPTPAAPAEPPSGEMPAEATTLDGLRAWVAQLDRKLGTRFYALGAGTVLALAAGIVAIVLVLGVKEDSATSSDLDELREEVSGVERSASRAAEEEVAALGDRVSQLESQLQSLRSDQTSTDQEISVLQDDIADLRDDVSALESAPADSGGSNNNER
jgi:septal ring factor EnvC (AmiA/AmiB activator)